jgi:hypothetical protein
MPTPLTVMIASEAHSRIQAYGDSGSEEAAIVIVRF